MKRQVSAFKEVEVLARLAIKGGSLKEVMVLTTVRKAQRECVQLYPSEHRDGTCVQWLRLLLTGMASSRRYDDAVANFVRDCRHALLPELEAHASAEEKAADELVLPLVPEETSLR